MVNVARMTEQLLLHEGVVLKFYTDTLGNQTLGVGYNVTARGLPFFERIIGRKLNAEGDISREEALLVLGIDIQRVQGAVKANFPDFFKLNEVRQRVCVDIAFNIGWHALDFKKCIKAIQKQDWSAGARELYRSKWSLQVGDGEGKRRDRCDRLAGMLLTGLDYTS